MNKEFNGLVGVHIELTDRCNKNCWMCGRRKVDRDYPNLLPEYGDMPYSRVEKIASELPAGIVVQLHNNGEPLLYPHFGAAVRLFHRQICCVDTNGKLLVEKASEIIGYMDTLTVSTFENDEEADEQYALLKEFLAIKGDQRPNVIVRCLGEMSTIRYETLGCLIATRVLHKPMGSFGYTRKVTVPEIGICLDMLGHMAIRRDGKVSICVRFDPQGLGIVGDCNTTSLADIWNSSKRMQWLRYHISGSRYKVPLCRLCEFWGVPVG